MIALLDRAVTFWLLCVAIGAIGGFTLTHPSAVIVLVAACLFYAVYIQTAVWT